MKKKQRDKLFFTIFMYLVTLVIFYPMVMMLLVSLKSKAESGWSENELPVFQLYGGFP